MHNYKIAGLRVGEQKWVIKAVTNDVESDLVTPVSDATLQPDHWYQLDLVVELNQVTLYADGQDRVTWQRGSGQRITGGRVGVMVRGGIAEFQELEVWDVTEATKYYAIGGQRVALRRSGVLYYVHTDHLGSTSVLTDANGAEVPGTRLKYYPFGAPRPDSATAAHNAFATGYSDATFTGQRRDVGTGLYHYGARYYDSAIGRFLQADTVIPNVGDPQNLNRYAYGRNNPLKYRDPSGHWLETAWDVLNIAWDIAEVKRDPSAINIIALVVDVGAAIAPAVPAGAGLLARGGKAAKAAVEVATHADEVADVAKAASKIEDVRHATTSAEAVQSILKGIDPQFFSPKGRFGPAFYAAQEGVTAVAEVRAAGKEATHVIRFQLDLGKARILDLTNPDIAKAWGYVRDPKATDLHQAIARKALEAGYDVIKFESYQVSGTLNYAVLRRFEELLIPQMVSPVP